MTAQRRRFVDSHLHLWDAQQNDWYVFPQPGDDRYGLGLKKPFPARYLWQDYLDSVSTVELVKWVHVTALTTPTDSLAESAWVAANAAASGLPYALIGTVDVTSPLSAIEAVIDQEQKHPAYRGLRVLSGLDYASDLAQGLLSMLSARRLVYDVVAGPAVIGAVAKSLGRHPALTVVLEHAGWPSGTSRAHFEEWRAAMTDFAALPNAFCKLSGLGMVVHRNDESLFRLFFDECVRLFGADRCMFGSNLPIDLSYGSGAALLTVFETVASAYSDEEASALFERTATRAYRL